MAGAQYVFFSGDVLHRAVQVGAHGGKRLDFALGSFNQQSRTVSESKYLARAGRQLSGSSGNRPFNIPTRGSWLLEKPGYGINDGQRKGGAQSRNCPSEKSASFRLRHILLSLLGGALIFGQFRSFSLNFQSSRSLLVAGRAVCGTVMLNFFPGLIEIESALAAVSQLILLRIPVRIFVIMAGDTTFFWLRIHSACD